MLDPDLSHSAGCARHRLVVNDVGGLDIAAFELRPNQPAEQLGLQQVARLFAREPQQPCRDRRLELVPSPLIGIITREVIGIQNAASARLPYLVRRHQHACVIVRSGRIELVLPGVELGEVPG